MNIPEVLYTKIHSYMIDLYFTEHSRKFKGVLDTLVVIRNNYLDLYNARWNIRYKKTTKEYEIQIEGGFFSIFLSPVPTSVMFSTRFVYDTDCGDWLYGSRLSG